ncbi:DNA-3-methyladenine glycosylase [Daejeonella oryzae]|uniref:DNA-3-methyladenine glycosylase n=1 Tax=Daejeonella oryzae TaxID=1122943 RepID=UPI000423D4A6|nr:DNA-3-methyladenine glycosylase [Daejeonella oryzae]
MKLPLSFYEREDALAIAKDLIGKVLLTNVENELTGGIIVETEAYLGPEDRGSHAFNNKRTGRNEMMFHSGGFVYMYICYGIHDMLNIVTGKKDIPHAILIRAIEPTVGLEIIKMRRENCKQSFKLCQGPGSLAKALGLTKLHNGIDLKGNTIWIEDHGISFKDDDIIAAPRVGMNFEGEFKTVPWRFLVKNNKFVSRPNYGNIKSEVQK